MNSVKKVGKNILCILLEKQAARLRKKQKFILVAVAGSVGKTSTKLAIAEVLSASKKVRYQVGNYNDRLTVPLVIFGHSNPGLFNLFAWAKILISNEVQIQKKYPYDVVVAELGTDGPGQIAEFAYLKPDLAVVTATTEEHMEFFGSVSAVAEEELSVANFSSQLLLNADDVSAEYRKNLKSYLTYGASQDYDYTVGLNSSTKTGQKVTLRAAGKKPQDANIKLLGKQGAKVALAAYATAVYLGIDPSAAKQAVEQLEAFSGRMRLMRGQKNSTIIDDSYNASPAAVTAALEVLYSMEAPQKIAILGNMNELGEQSKQLHQDMGKMCDPKQLDLVVFIGPDAKKYSSPEAMKKGCKVEIFDSPYAAGEFVASKLKEGAVVLAKGSQNRVFAEESIKSLLESPEDAAQLVRQSDFWLGVKKQQFKDFRG